MMTRILLMIALLGVLLSAEAQQAFSLDEAVQYAMEHSRQVAIQEKEIDDAEGQILEYKSIGIPKLEGNVDYTYYFDIQTFLFPDVVTPVTYSILYEEGLLDPEPIPQTNAVPAQFGTSHNLTAGLNFNTLLFDFSWIQGLKAQELYRELVVRELDVTEYEVRAAITRAYLAVLIAQRSSELLDNNIANIERLLTETRALYETGFAEKLDVDRLELSRNNLLTEKNKVVRSIEVTKNLLKFQMGYPVDQEIILTDEFDILADKMRVESVDLTDPIDYNSRPEYRALELSEQLSETNLKVIRGGYYPNLSASAGYAQQLQRNTLFDSNDNPWFPLSFAGVSLNVPIFDGLEKKAKMQRAQIDLEQLQLRKQDFESSMTIEVKNARINYLNSRETVQSRSDAMELAQSIYTVTQVKYREGVGSSVELTQAESELYNAQTNFIDALYDLILAKTELDIALGKM